MNQVQLIEKLKSGAQVANRGTGWWLITASRPNIDRTSIQVETALIDAVNSQGLARIEFLTVSTRRMSGRPMRLVLN